MRHISCHAFLALSTLCLMASCSYISSHPALERDIEVVGVEALDEFAHRIESSNQ